MPIKKLGGGKYFIRVTVYINKKKRERKFTGVLPTMGAARSKEEDLKNELLNLKEYEENEEKRYTWKKALNEYLEYSEYNHRLSTFYNRMKVLEAHTSELNNREVDSISKKEIKELIDNIEITLTSKKELLKYIRQVFELAIDNRKLSINPARNLKLHGDKAKREKANRLTAMTQDELKRFLKAVKTSDSEWYSIFYVTYQLGLRSSEAIALEFTDIDWNRDHIVISKSWCKKKKGFVPHKNGTSRIIPMNNQLKEFLLALKRTSGSSNFVLPRNKNWLGGRATRILQEYQKKLNIKLTNYHSLRASFITHLLRSGLDIIRVQAMVGHRELSTTQRYIRLDATDLQGVTDSLKV